MRLLHLTDIACLDNILATGVYRPVSEHPLNGDAGLNCFDAHRAGSMGQSFERTGAILVCEWIGPISVIGMNACAPYPSGTLYDMLPWRCFVPIGTSGTLLRAVGFKLEKDAVDEYLESTNTWWVPNRVRDGLFRRRKLKLLKRLRKHVRGQMCYLRVGGR